MTYFSFAKVSHTFGMCFFLLFCLNGFCGSLPFMGVTQKGIEGFQLELISNNDSVVVTDFALKQQSGLYGVPLHELFRIKAVRFPGFSHTGLIGLRFKLFIPSDLPDAEQNISYSSSQVVQNAVAQLQTVGLERGRWVETTVWLPDFQNVEEQDAISFKGEGFYGYYKERVWITPDGRSYDLIDEARRNILNADAEKIFRQVLLHSVELVLPAPLSGQEVFKVVRELSTWPFEGVIVRLFFIVCVGILFFPLFFMRKYLSMKIIILLFLPIGPLFFFLFTRAREFVGSLEESAMQEVLTDLSAAFSGVNQVKAKTAQELENELHDMIDALHNKILENQDENGNNLFNIPNMQWREKWQRAVKEWTGGDETAYGRLQELAKDAVERFLPYCQKFYHFNHHRSCVNPADEPELPFPGEAGWDDAEWHYFTRSRNANSIFLLIDKFYRNFGIEITLLDESDYLLANTGMQKLFMEQIFQENDTSREDQPLMVNKGRQKFGEMLKIMHSGGMDIFFFSRFLDQPLVFYNLLPVQKGELHIEDSWVIRPSRGGKRKMFFFIRNEGFWYGKIFYRHLEEYFSGQLMDYFVVGEPSPLDFPVRNYNHPFFFCGAELIAAKGLLGHYIFRGSGSELFAVYGAPVGGANPYTPVVGCYIHQYFIALKYKKIWYMLLVILFLLIFVVMALFISKRILSPLSQLASGMDRISQRNYDSGVLVSSEDEFAGLADICNTLCFSLSEKERLTGFLSEEVVSSIIDDNFCTTREQVSILFCGVLNDDDYETYDFSERLAVFNSFLVAVQNQLFLHGGIMDKFTGTACLGFFQGTNITKSPLLTAQGIRKALLELNHEFVKNGKKPLKAGIGIATGPVVLGYIGASKRRDFTSIGNTVNMAARLETFAINSTSEVSVFLDEVTFRQHEVFISDNDNFHFHCHTGISLKGKQGEQIIYELL